ncbi:MAG: sulfotransferase family protein [Thermodesulfobacteriota bacterium]
MTEITVVSGLPRSGTSMMMAMLAAAGRELLVDDRRTADEDNPRGYYEYEKVKRLQKDSSWLAEAQGRVVKIVSPLLPFLPAGQGYRIVFMERRLEEILASQHRMLARSGKPAAADDGRMLAFYASHLEKIDGWLAGRPDINLCRISFNRLFSDDAKSELDRLVAFFGQQLDPVRLRAVIDAKLYRNRR